MGPSTPTATTAGAAAGTAPTARWEGRGVHLAEVVSEAERMRADAERGATRAAVVNLVVETCDEAEVAVVRDTLAGLGAHHPGRIIIVSAQPDAAPGIDAAVERYEARAGRPLWWEVIRLWVRGPAAVHLESVVDPLLLHDLHLAVWHTGPIPDPDELLSAAGQVLIGGTSAHDPAAAAARLDRRLASVERLARIRPVTDLAWLRAEPWRRALARLFDPPAARELLGAVEAVTASGRPWPALLLAGWLRDRLALPPDRVELRPTDGPPVLALRVSGRGVRVAETDAGPVAAAMDGGRPALAGARPGGTAGLLTAALSRPGRDRAYEAALAAAGGLVA